MRHNVKDISAVIKDLIPKVVPYAMSEMPSTVSILSYFPMVIYLISPEIPSDLPTDIAWVHLLGTEKSRGQSQHVRTVCLALET